MYHKKASNNTKDAKKKRNTHPSALHIGVYRICVMYFSLYRDVHAAARIEFFRHEVARWFSVTWDGRLFNASGSSSSGKLVYLGGCGLARYRCSRRDAWFGDDNEWLVMAPGDACCEDAPEEFVDPNESTWSRIVMPFSVVYLWWFGMVSGVLLSVSFSLASLENGLSADKWGNPRVDDWALEMDDDDECVEWLTKVVVEVAIEVDENSFAKPGGTE